mmetsp:Transcript_11999/g.39492  ORF Transcript_11999/g.39492 Transcript_11999/m.39492 type:complete len:94 (+) Transcript_11999:1163-1444(+)
MLKDGETLQQEAAAAVEDGDRHARLQQRFDWLSRAARETCALELKQPQPPTPPAASSSSADDALPLAAVRGGKPQPRGKQARGKPEHARIPRS